MIQVNVLEVQDYSSLYRFSVADYQRLYETGILAADRRTELIAGNIVEMSPIGKRHAACVNRLVHWLTAQLQGQAIVSVQNSVQMTDSFPQPDIAVLRWRSNFYEDGYPTPADVQLLIEVADSTARYDRQVKGALYAREAIGDYWLVDLEQRHLEAYRSPRADGYGDRLILQPGETIAPIAFPDQIIAVEQCFAALSSP